MKRLTFFLVAACLATLTPAAFTASCCDGGNCCKGGKVCCSMKGCCKPHGKCCDAKNKVCKDSCGCSKNKCCDAKKPHTGSKSHGK